MDELKSPNQEYLEFNCVKETATGKGNNEYFSMENLHDGTFRATQGRVGIRIGRNAPRTYIRPMEDWESTYVLKINKEWILTKQKKTEKKEIQKTGFGFNGQMFKIMEDISVNEIITKLLTYANTVIEQNYTTKVDDISEEMMEFANKIMTNLGSGYENMSVAEFNTKLRTLFAAIPRRMDNVSKCLATRKAEFSNILAEEQSLLDIVLGQVKNDKLAGSEKTVCEAYGLNWREVNEEEKDYILDKLTAENRNQYVNAWRISNIRTEENFKKFCNDNKISDQGIKELFHGSRNENFWSIVTNGLILNPSGVVITGKMFGNGICVKCSAITCFN